MIQTILVILIFAVAVFFIARKLYLSFTGRKAPGCEKCAANEINMMENH